MNIGFDRGTRIGELALSQRVIVVPAEPTWMFWRLAGFCCRFFYQKWHWTGEGEPITIPELLDAIIDYEQESDDVHYFLFSNGPFHRNYLKMIGTARYCEAMVYKLIIFRQRITAEQLAIGIEKYNYTEIDYERIYNQVGKDEQGTIWQGQTLV